MSLLTQPCADVSPGTDSSHGSGPSPQRVGCPSWGRLYLVLLAGIVLCLLGDRLSRALGHATLLQAVAALTILGLLLLWARTQRRALGRPASQPFCVIRVAFPQRRPRARLAAQAPPPTPDTAAITASLPR